MILRDYQQKAVEKMLWARSLEGNDLVTLPQGSGKSVIIAHLAKQLNEPILILQPNKEILEQNMEKLLHYVDHDEIGVYSASMGSKTVNSYTFATIGSIYKKKDDFRHFRLVLLDECNQLNPKKLDTMYMQFFEEIECKVFGLTATPYRMDVRYEKKMGARYAETVHCTKLINRMKNRFWHRMLAVVQTSELLEQGYLSPLKYHHLSLVDRETIPVNKSHSDFDLQAYEEIITPKLEKVVGAIQEVVNSHKSTVVFCSSVEQAEKLSTVFKSGAVVSAKTPKKERDAIITSFKVGETKVVFNVNILSYGFDHPELDAIVIMRPTKSMAWHLQALGRGMRRSDLKGHCDVYDFAGNVSFLGTAESHKILKIDGKWEIQTNAGTWHNRELYRFKPKLKPWFR